MNPHPLQSRLPSESWLDIATRRLPGVQPIEPHDWLVRDDAFAGQMAIRDELIASRPEKVHAVLPESRHASIECLDLVLDTLAGDPDYRIGSDEVVRPDGLMIAIDRSHPLLTAGRLVQEDLCVMQESDGGHVLTGAILCFPASWTLSEKIGRPLGAIHRPVASYNAALERRVQRLFDAIRVEQPLWRANALIYEDPALHQPRREGDGPRSHAGPAGYLRSERQTLRRLPETGAVIFSIHTYVVALENLSLRQRAIVDDSGLIETVT